MNKYDEGSSKKRESKIFTDYEIFQGKVRLIVEGKAPIIIERDAAIEMAKSENKNLVQIAYNKNDFPHAVCKILDYGKCRYEQQKKEKAAKKAARAAQAELKEIVFSIRIDENDRRIKIEHIKEFLAEANTKVKITVKLAKRELDKTTLGKQLLKGVLTELNDVAVFDAPPKAEGRSLFCILRKRT